MYHRWSKKSQHDMQDPSTFTNEHYLNTPQKKTKMEKLKKRARVAECAVEKQQDRIRRLTMEQGETLEATLQSDMEENTDRIKSAYTEGSFARLFWEEQLKASSIPNMKQVRWHPVIIKWCLNLKLLSSSVCHALRTSGYLRKEPK